MRDGPSQLTGKPVQGALVEARNRCLSGRGFLLPSGDNAEKNHNGVSGYTVFPARAQWQPEAPRFVRIAGACCACLDTNKQRGIAIPPVHVSFPGTGPGKQLGRYRTGFRNIHIT